MYFSALYYLKLEPEIQIQIENQTKPEITEKLNYQEKQGIKILTLKSENNYQNGYYHGQKLEKEIKELVNYFKNDMLWKDRYLWWPIYSLLNYKAKKFIPYIPEENIEEMKWIADWANISFNDILLINTYDDLLQISGCSSMIVPKNQDFSENFVHTRNLDYQNKNISKK